MEEKQPRIWKVDHRRENPVSSTAMTKSTSTATAIVATTLEIATVAATPETSTAPTSSGGSHCLVIRECNHRELPRQRLEVLGFWGQRCRK